MSSHESGADECDLQLREPLTSLKNDCSSYSCVASNHNLDAQSSWLSCFILKKKSSKTEPNRDYTMIQSSCSNCKDSSVQTGDWTSNSQDRRGMCGPFSWSILPIVLSITSSIGFIVTYFFALNNCHIQKWIFPYLSYTGTEHPESMIFGLILNTEGFLGLTVVFLSWRYYRHMGQRGFLNHFALFCGGLSCFGVIMVGNFQVTKAQIPHYIGAGLTFIVGTAYGILTASLSRKAFRLADPPLRHGVCVAVVRAALAIVMIIELVCLTGVGMYKKLNAKNVSKEFDNDTMRLKANGSCLELLNHIPPLERYIDLVGSLTEWLLTACLLLCLSLFAYEFQTFQNVKVVLLRHDGPLRCSVRNFENKRKKKFSGSMFSSTVNPHSDSGDFGKPVYGRNFQPCTRNDCYRFDSRFEGFEFRSKGQRSVATSCPFSHITTADSGIEDDYSFASPELQKFLHASRAKIQRTRSLPNVTKADAV